MYFCTPIENEMKSTHNMEVKMREELRRQMCSPIFWGLLAGAMLMNLWILVNFSSQRKMVQRSRGAWEKLQLPVSEESAGRYLGELESVEAKVKGVPTFEQMMTGTLYMMQKLDGDTLGAAFVSSMMLKEGAQEYVEGEYDKLEKVLEKNRRDGTAAAFFVPGNQGFFELFSRWIPLFCTLESILAGVMFMMRSVSEPFSSGTAIVVYATKTGRKSQDKRRRAAALSGVLFTVSTWGITCLAACAVFPLGSLWKTRIGSMMLLDSLFPMVSRFPMTAAGYVVLESAVSIFTAVLFSYISFAFVTRNKNSFVSFVQLGFACACIFTMTSLFPKNSRIFFAMQYNPVDLAQKAGHWLVSGGTFFSPQYYELFVLLLWGSFAGFAVYRARKRFEREDL